MSIAYLIEYDQVLDIGGGYPKTVHVVSDSIEGAISKFRSKEKEERVISEEILSIKRLGAILE